MTIKEAQELIAKDIEKAKQEAFRDAENSFPKDEWEKYVPEELRNEALNFTIQEKREILAAAKAKFAPEPAKDPEIPKYIEVPKPKDWNSFGSIAVPGNGEPNPSGAMEMERRINPRWVEAQKHAAAQNPPPQAAPLTYGNAIADPFDHVMNIGYKLSDIYTVKHFQQLTPDTITVTFALKG